MARVATPPTDPWTYVVTDVELDGPWPGEVEHTHRAIDDTVGYAHLLAELLRRSGGGRP